MNPPEKLLTLSSRDASEEKGSKAAVVPSAGMQQSEARLTTIPMEILLFIIPLLETKEIKIVRLTCWYLADVAAYILFKEMVLFPSIESARRITKFARETSLGKYVQTLRYDGRWFNVIPSISKSMSVDQGVQAFLKDLRELDDLQFHFNHRGRCLETSHLSLIFYALPNLRHVLVQGPERSIENLPLPKYYRKVMDDAQKLLPNKVFGVDEAWARAPQRSNGVLLALFSSQKKVETLELSNSNLQNIFCGDGEDNEDADEDGFLELELDFVIGLRSLKIHLEESCEYDEIKGYTESLGMMLQKMKRLKSLSLRLLDSPMDLEDVESEELIEVFSPVFEFQSDSLTHVSLSGVAVTRQILVDFVLRHATSLALFRISEARLVTDSNDENAQLHWEAMIESLKPALKEWNFVPLGSGLVIEGLRHGRY
jgi:hypothetical protein